MPNKSVALRVGSVPFVNARPLVHFLDLSGDPPIELTLEVPSRLTRMMEDGALDAALLPSIEYFRSGDYTMIPDISISADGVVESVRIFSKVPIEDIRLLALDERSRTSATLARILLKRKLGSLPELTSCAPDAQLGELDADAMLLIGDSTMAFRSESAVAVLDLGEEWKRLTGLPFVYAMWVVRRGVDAGSLHSKLLRARDEGLANLTEVAAKASKDTGLSEENCLNYLKNVMRYNLDERELEALRRFQELASEDGLCPGGVELVFAD